MTTLLVFIGAFVIGYYIGRRVGIAQAMIRMQDIIAELQQIEMFFNNLKKQWNEDNL